MRRTAGSKAFPVAATGIIAALSLLTLYISAILPVAQAGLVAVAGVFVGCVVVSVGLAAGLCGYVVVSLLGLLLVPEKGCVLLFILFFGLYPILKSLFERHLSIAAWPLKFAFFNAMLLLLWFALRTILLPFLPTRLDALPILLIVGNLAFLIYDIGFSRLMTFYAVRVDRVLHRHA
ncbi:MAG: hypothetical protein LIO58_08190 [Oscillospiraceae bacterium]|nr:hypothetical protein [Oscillospiraceae bacterium]